MPGEMYRVFTHYKRDEWERFMSTVTDWDLKQYWDYCLTAERCSALRARRATSCVESPD